MKRFSSFRTPRSEFRVGMIVDSEEELAGRVSRAIL